jgi:hypothetical protein
MEQEARMTDVTAIQRFIFAGNATLTVRSARSGARFTYKISEGNANSPRKPLYFVRVLNGPDNESNFGYLGYIKDNTFIHGKEKAVAKEDAPSVVAFRWSFSQIMCGTLPAELEIWHEGRCGRCGRKLTVPESVATGLGPECATMGQVVLPLIKKSEPNAVDEFKTLLTQNTRSRKPAPPASVYAANGFRSKSEAQPQHTAAEIEQMILECREKNPHIYYGDFKENGVTEQQIHDFWYRRFESIPLENFQTRRTS